MPDSHATSSNHHTPVWEDVVLVGVMLLFGFLLLFRLDAYALWDDEANTAILATNLWNQGDVSAFDGRNLVAFREGFELVGLKNRVLPPGQYVFAAPFMGLLGHTTFAARLPFALAAWAGLCGLALWVRRRESNGAMRLAMLLLLLGNVSIFLYGRQARYYGLTFTLTVAVVWLYLHRTESRWNRPLLALAGVGLLSSQYINYGATMVCLALDWVLFERRHKRDSPRQGGLFLGIQVVAFVAIVGVFNPLGRGSGGFAEDSYWLDRVYLLSWNLRDVNAAEFIWSPILFVAGAAWALGRFKDQLLFRSGLALGAYTVMVTLLSQQRTPISNVADVRYLVPAIPLAIYFTARSLITFPRLPAWSAWLAVCVLAFTNAPHVAFLRATDAPKEVQVPLRSSMVAWWQELAAPQRSSFLEAADWLNTHVAEDALVHVVPDYGVYPLMFHAPQLQYMWQLRRDQHTQFPSLPQHHFKGRGLPDVVVAFGPAVEKAEAFFRDVGMWGVAYSPPVVLDVAGPDKTRPELFWRSFTTEPPKDMARDATYIFTRVTRR